MASVLVADDEAPICRLVARWGSGLGYEVETVGGADEALARLDSFPADLVLSDLRMPAHDGLWLTSELRKWFPDTAVAIMTGAQDLESVVNSMRAGVVDYLLKPFDRHALQQVVERGLSWHEQAVAARERRESLDRELDRKTSALFDAVRTLETQSDATVEMMMAMLMGHDPVAWAHGWRVAEQSVAVGRLLGLSARDLELLYRAALLHDLGKIAIPQHVLSKPADLTGDERTLIARHPQIGHDLIHTLPFLEGVAGIVLSVHEHHDGSGYPGGLAGDAIPLASRVIAVVDTFDAMTHARSYSKAMPALDAQIVVAEACGTQFDPVVVHAWQEATKETEEAGDDVANAHAGSPPAA